MAAMSPDLASMTAPMAFILALLSFISAWRASTVRLHVIGRSAASEALYREKTGPDDDGQANDGR